MVNRKKRLERGIASLEEQLRLHEEKLQRAMEDDNDALAGYYRKELSAKQRDLDEKKRLLAKGG